MAPFINILLFGALASTNQQQNNNKNKNKNNKPSILLEVCQSPGCIADGGEATFKKCMAYAPPLRPDLIQVQKGGCVSACGNGPVIRINEQKVYKRVLDVVPLMEELLRNNYYDDEDQQKDDDDNDSCDSTLIVVVIKFYVVLYHKKLYKGMIL